jgi:flagellar basal body-associated protein FliL
MAKRRRPSIPLTILFVILLVLFLLAGPLADFIISGTSQGTFKFKFDSTRVDDPVVSIVYTLPQDLAEAMAPEQTEGWTVTLTGNTLSLTNGTLDAGESVTVSYRLTKYIESGTRNYTATATTRTGALIPSEKSLNVPELFPLAIAGMLTQNAIWLLVLALVVLVVIVVLFVLGERKKEEPEQEEEKQEEQTEE